MEYTIRRATPADAEAVEPMLPRLANFTVPEARTPEQLWQGDRNMLIGWAKGENECVVYVATRDNDQGDVIGACIVSFREEMLSHEPSAHLEVLVIAEEAEGHGIGHALLNQAQEAAREAGAKGMSLHVFANNTRARGLYEKAGFDGEILRYYKPL